MYVWESFLIELLSPLNIARLLLKNKCCGLVLLVHIFLKNNDNLISVHFTNSEAIYILTLGYHSIASPNLYLYGYNVHSHEMYYFAALN
jgi:hypothetical protein